MWNKYTIHILKTSWMNISRQFFYPNYDGLVPRDVKKTNRTQASYVKAYLIFHRYFFAF